MRRPRRGSAYGIRTRVTAVRGRRPGPLDECATMAWDAEDTERPLRSQGRVTLGRRRNSTRVGVFWSGMKARRFVLVVMVVLAAFAGLADEASNDKVVLVESK